MTTRNPEPVDPFTARMLNAVLNKMTLSETDIGSMYVEAFPHGDGHDHECAECHTTIGATDDLLVVDGAPYHRTCWE